MEEKQERAQAHEECVCRAFWRELRDILPDPPSDRTRDHFRNSRIEFLKGIRSLIDDRIDRLQRAEAKGTTVVVE